MDDFLVPDSSSGHDVFAKHRSPLVKSKGELLCRALAFLHASTYLQYNIIILYNQQNNCYYHDLHVCMLCDNRKQGSIVGNVVGLSQR